MTLSTRRSASDAAASDGLPIAGANSKSSATRAAARYALPIAAIVASYWVLGRNDFGSGGDEGIHFGIATQLAEQGHWPLRGPFLALIGHYPPAAHALAAMLGKLAGSTLHGMFIVIALAFAVIYFAIAELMRRRAPAQTVAAIFLFALLAVCLRKFKFVAGNEVVNNFFFAQFAGTACLLAGTLFLARLRWAFVSWLAVAVVAVHVAGWFYPLNAAELAVAGTVLRLRPGPGFSAPLGPRLVEASVAAVVLGGAAVIHPAIIDMVTIAANDGDMSVTTATAVACALVMILVGLPATVALSRRSGMVHGEALAALAAAALVPSIALLAALVFFGLGSVYAIKKSVFLLGTLNLVILSCLGVEWPPVSRIAERVFSPRATSFAASAAGPLLVIAALAFVYLGRPSIPVDVTARYDRQLQSVMREPDATVLEGVSVSMNSAYDRNVNFTVAVARLQPGPRAYWAQVALFRRQPLGLQPLSNAGAQYALVGAAEAVRYTDACRFRQYVEVVVLHFACAYDAAAH